MTDIIESISRFLKKIDTNWFETICISVVFGISLYISSFFPIAYLLSALLVLRGPSGALKGLFLIALRSYLYIHAGPATTSTFGSYARYFAIYFLCIYLLCYYLSLQERERKTVNSIGLVLLIFALYCIFAGAFKSSMPFVTILKTFNYAIPFFAVLTGIAVLNKRKALILWIFSVYTVFVLWSMVINLTGGAYQGNTDLFRGAFHLSTSFGIAMSIYLSLCLYLLHNKMFKRSYIVYGLMLIAFYLLYLSKARTGLFTSTAILVFAFFYEKRISTSVKIAAIIGFICFYIASALFWPYIFEKVNGIIYKYGEGNFFGSREEQFENALINFQANPILGTGFQTPVLEERSMEITLKAYVEDGNLALGILAQTGVIGAILFLALIISFFMNSYNPLGFGIILFATCILVNMGELSFFSTTGNGTMMYIFIGMYIFDKEKHRTRSITQVVRRSKRMVAL